jgi:hypothetical protein
VSQLEYIAILFADLGYDTSAQRRGWLQLRFGVSYPDDLTFHQRSKVIDSLKAEKSEGLA